MTYDFRIVFFGHPIQEVRSNAVGRIVAQVRIALSAEPDEVGAVSFRLEFEPSDVIRDTLS